jgi:hypothetical protein
MIGTDLPYYIVGRGSLKLKGIDIDGGRPRVKFGIAPQKSFRFYNLRTAANFYLMYSKRNNFGWKAMVDSLARDHKIILSRSDVNEFKYVTPTINLSN